MGNYVKKIFTNIMFLPLLIVMIITFILAACNSDTVTSSSTETQYPTTITTTLSTTTTTKPPGVPGSTLLPENAPNAAHFLGGGACFEHHGIPPEHGVELQNQFACDRCHVQTSTIIPTDIPTITPENVNSITQN
jgi:hypothetical protein